MFAALRAKQPGSPLWRIAVYEVVCWCAFSLLSLFLGFRARGRENVPATGPLLLAANHESYLDPPCISSALCPRRHTTFIARAGLFKVRPFAWLIATLNSVPIKENQGDTAAIKETIRRLEGGHTVLIFPEGARTLDGSIGEFKRGVALLMKKARCPVVPVAIKGAFEAWPRSRKFPRVFAGPLRVLYGTPIAYEELMKDGPDAGLARLREEIVRLRAELDRA